jgi:hypothetical protein
MTEAETENNATALGEPRRTLDASWIDNVTLCWLTNAAISSARRYKPNPSSSGSFRSLR